MSARCFRTVPGSVPFIGRAFLAVLLFLFCSAVASAREDAVIVPGDLSIQSRVDFWKLIFTKYGKDQIVFHFRDHPGVVYSALDFGDLLRDYGPQKAKIIANQQIEDEQGRIRASLIHLGDGGEPRGPFERRIERLFKTYKIDSRSQYRLAAEPKQIRFQTGIRELFRDGLIRSTRYLFAIEKIFVQRGLPVELARLPLIESSFNYKAYSSVGAAGIWQFMRGTGKKYLRINTSVDERRDPIQATRAAAEYLAHAYETLGTWPLAVTSYNHGITGVLRGVKHAGTTNLGTIIEKYDGATWGFASQNFYCEFLAAVEVEANVERYFPGLSREAPRYFEELEAVRPVAFRTVASAAGMGHEGFADMNPALLSPITKGRIPIPAGTVVKVPLGHGKKVAAAVKSLRLYSVSGPGAGVRAALKDEEESTGRRVFSSKVTTPATPGSGKVHIVKAGETVGAIAGRHGVSAAAVLKANGLKDARRLKIGQKLKIPSAVPPARKTSSGKKVVSKKVARR